MTIQTPAHAELRETAIHALVTYSQKDRAGTVDAAAFRATVQPALDAARTAGFSGADIHGEADRRYGQWLIDNSRQAA